MQRTGKDALSRETEGYYLKVKPSNDGTHSYVGIYIQTESNVIEFDPNKVKTLGDGLTMTTSKATVDKSYADFWCMEEKGSCGVIC